MLSVPSVGLHIHPLIRAVPLSCWRRQLPIAWTRAATRHQKTVVSKGLFPPATTSPQLTKTTDGANSKLGKDGSTMEQLQGQHTGVTGHHAIQPINVSAQITKDKQGQCLRIIATTQSSDDAWNAYRIVSTSTREPAAQQKFAIPHEYSHRLARLLASTKPKTRTLFLRLLSVLAALKKEGGTIYVWEWNALIDCAGKGWRKTRPEDYRAALDIYNDMISQSPPEKDGDEKATTNQEHSEGTVTDATVAEPDIITYTTLLYIACRTLIPAIVRHAGHLLKSSGLRPTQVTHLSMLRYFSQTRQLSGVRSTIMRMREQGFKMEIDGINACMTAFMRNSQMDVASTIYRVLRHHVVPELEVGEHDIDAAIRYLDIVEGLVIAEDLIPDHISYTIIIQGLAYRGDLIQSLQVFSHMLSSPSIKPLASVPGETGEFQSADCPTTLPIFRILFLGFARHAEPPQPKRRKEMLSTRLRNLANPSTASPWTLSNLEQLFKSFLELPEGTRPSDRTIYWILVAFTKTSGNDVNKLRKVWSQLQLRFKGRWSGRLKMLREKVYGDLPDDDEWEHLN